jgi:ABC-type transport system substrate-binding protein
LRIRLKEPDLRFLYGLAVPNTTAVAREVVEAYGLDFGAHPVGTGPYMLGEYKRSSKITLVANPDYREVTYTPAGPIPPEWQSIAAALKGKRLPIPGRIEISVIEEGQARWLAFLNRELDLLERLPEEFTEQALAGGKLKPDLAAKGIRHEILLRPNTWWTYFNMDDPVVGGYTPEKIALRRAIGMAYDQSAVVRIVLKGRAIPALSPVPPDIAGYDPTLKTNAQLFDPAAARALLDRFGYKDRDGDGYRELPDGTPLTLVLASTTDAAARVSDELWKRNMDAIGVRVTFLKNKWPELNKMSEAGQLMMWGLGWISSIPDGRDYYSYFYSRNIGTSNDARMRLPAMDALFEQSLALPDGPQRTALFDRMNDLIFDYAPWILTDYRYTNVVAQPWLKGYKLNDFIPHQWWYYDVAAR